MLFECRNTDNCVTHDNIPFNNKSSLCRRGRTYVHSFAAVDSSVDLSVVEDSKDEGARNVRVGTLGPARHVAVDDSAVYRHS